MEKKVYVLTEVTPDEKGKINYIAGSLAVFETLGKEMLPKVLEAVTLQCPGVFINDFEDIYGFLNEKYASEILKALEGDTEVIYMGKTVYTFREVTLKTDESGEKADILSKKMYLYQRFKRNFQTGEAEEEGFFTTCGEEFYKLIPLVKKGKPLGLSLNHYMPFSVKDGKAYMYDFEGEPCGGPFEYVESHSGLLFFVAESTDKKYFVDFMGNRLTGENIIFNSGDDYNGYILFKENEKWGFINVDSHTVSPVEYDDIEPIELAEAIKVKKGDEWGYLAEDFTFIPESLIEEDDSNWDDVYWYGDEP